MDKRLKKGLVVGMSGLSCATLVLNPIVTEAKGTDTTYTDEYGFGTTTKKKTSTKQSSKAKSVSRTTEAITITDIGIFPILPQDYVIDGENIVFGATSKLSVVAAPLLEGYSLESVFLSCVQTDQDADPIEPIELEASKDEEGLYSTDMSLITEPIVNYTVNYDLGNETVLSQPLGEWFKDIKSVEDTSMVIIDTDIPETGKVTFSGTSVVKNGVVYYTTDGSVSFEITDTTYGLNQDSLKIDGAVGVEKSFTYTDGVFAFDTSLLPEGNHVLTVSGKDVCGNEFSKVLNIFMVREMATITGTTESSYVESDGKTFVSSPLEISLEGYDADSIASVELYKGTNLLSIIDDGSFMISESGNYSVKVTDVVGNHKFFGLNELISGMPSEVVFDETLPVINIKVNGDEVDSTKWVLDNAILSLDFTDNEGLSSAKVTINGKEFSYDCGGANSFNQEINLKSDVDVANDGRYVVSVEARDLAGNTINISNRVVLADFNPPELGSIKGTGNFVDEDGTVYLKGGLVVEGEATDIGSGIKSVIVYKDGSEVADTLPYEITKTGKYSFKIIDESGQETHISLAQLLGNNSLSGAIVADNQAPTLKRTEHGFGPDKVIYGSFWYLSNPKLTWNITDNNLSEVFATVNGNTVEVSQDGDMFTVDTSGTYGSVLVNITAKDALGNEISDAYGFWVDNVAPEISSVTASVKGIESGKSVYFKNSVEFYVSAEDDVAGIEGYYLLHDGTEEFSETGSFSVGNGEYYVCVEDRMGNRSEPVGVGELLGYSSNVFVVDGTAPTIDTKRPDGSVSGWFNHDVIYEVQVKDTVGLKSVVGYINGEEVASNESIQEGINNLGISIDTSIGKPNQSGGYAIKVVATDNSGNVSTWEDTIYIDRTAPSITGFTFTGDDQQHGMSIGGSDEYGFFFKGSAKCSIGVSDGVVSSGVSKVYVDVIPESGDADKFTCDVIGGVAEFDLPKNFKGYVTAYAADNSGNVGTTSRPSGVVNEDVNWHLNNVSLAINLPDTLVTDSQGLPLYNNDLSCTAVIGCKMSGIKGLEWGINEATMGGIEVDAYGKVSGDQYLVQSSGKNLVLDMSETLNVAGNANGIKVWVSVTDNAGNVSYMEKYLSIDKDAPVISVSYNENNLSGYYKNTRVASIEIRERNFDPAKVSIRGTYGTLGQWRNTGDAWINTITFDESKPYQFSLDCTDKAGNKSTIYSSEEFVVDQIAPVLEVAWDNTSAENGMYYRAGRTATVTVKDVNFDPSMVSLKGSGALSAWTNNGDVHTATVSFAEDGEYEFSISGVDKAGNQMNSFNSGKFVIDKTLPAVTVSGIQEGISYKKELGFSLSFGDANVDTARTSVSLVGKRNGTLKLEGVVNDKSGNYYFTEFPMEEMYDDVYTLTVNVVDKAGNTTTKTVVFSVNRFGSSYEFANVSMLNSYLSKPQSVTIVEENIDRLDMNNARIVVLKDGEELKINPGYVSIVESLGESGKYTYTYTISADAFTKDGKYLVQIYSRANEGTEYSSVSEEYAFVLDTTAPNILVSGISSGQNYMEYSRKVTIDVRDLSGVNSIRVLLNGKEVNTDFVNGVYSFEVTESSEKQSFEVFVTDMAGNESSYEVKDFMITSSVLTYAVNQVWFKYGVGAAIAFLGVIIGLLFKRRYDSRKKELGDLKEQEEIYKASSSSLSTSGSASVDVSKDVVEDLDTNK